MGGGGGGGRSVAQCVAHFRQFLDMLQIPGRSRPLRTCFLQLHSVAAFWVAGRGAVGRCPLLGSKDFSTRERCGAVASRSKVICFSERSQGLCQLCTQAWLLKNSVLLKHSHVCVCVFVCECVRV